MKEKEISRRRFLTKGIGGLAFLAASSACLAGKTSNLSAPPLLSDWLESNRRVRNAIGWLFFNGSYPDLKNYSDWTSERKNELQQAFEAAWNYQPTNLPDPPPNLFPENSQDSPATIFSEETAWKYFAAFLANSLCLEIGKRVPWSIADYSNDALFLLFNGGGLFEWNRDFKGYSIRADGIGSFTPAPPDAVLKFLNAKHIISTQNPKPENSSKTVSGAEARLDVTAKFLDWARYNLTHFIGPVTADNAKAHWQYNGLPPVSRVLQGTINRAEKETTPRNWTMGCMGTVGLLNGVFRAINIPVERMIVCGHSLPYFSADELVMTHGDDIYTLFSRPASNESPLPFPPRELFISKSEFDRLFKAAESHDERCRIVGRRPTELAVKYLPPGLVEFYLSDKKQGKSHAEGKVFANLSQIYTLAGLESMKLWQRLEEKSKSL